MAEIGTITIALAVFGAAVGVQYLAKHRLETADILGGLGLAGAAGLLMRAFGKGESPGLANGNPQEVVHSTGARPATDPLPEPEAMQRAVAQAQSSYTPAGMDAALPRISISQSNKPVSKGVS